MNFPNKDWTALNRDHSPARLYSVQIKYSPQLHICENFVFAIHRRFNFAVDESGVSISGHGHYTKLKSRLCIRAIRSGLSPVESMNQLKILLVVIIWILEYKPERLISVIFCDNIWFCNENTSNCILYLMHYISNSFWSLSS
jgi:hypothetical protein